jgi:hypothetical protein
MCAHILRQNSSLGMVWHDKANDDGFQNDMTYILLIERASGPADPSSSIYLVCCARRGVNAIFKRLHRFFNKEERHFILAFT